MGGSVTMTIGGGLGLGSMLTYALGQKKENSIKEVNTKSYEEVLYEQLAVIQYEAKIQQENFFNDPFAFYPQGGGLDNVYPEFELLAIGKGVYNTFSNVAKEGVTIVGEGMKRVSVEATKHPNSVILNKMPTFTGAPHQVTSQMMTYNRQWMLQQMRSGRPIMDIGLDPIRTNPSIFYQMEQNMMRNYLKLHPDAFQIIRP